MLKIVNKICDVDFTQMANVYLQSNLEYGRSNCRNGTTWEQLRCGEMNMRDSLCCFLRTKGAILALWDCGGCCVSALRLEPYLDGFLLSCLETAPEACGKGYGTELVKAAAAYIDGRVYSHIHKKNAASLAVHKKASFVICADHARLLDGTVSQAYYTLCKE